MDIERVIFILLALAVALASLLIADTWPVRGVLTPVLAFGLVAVGTWVWQRKRR